MSVCSARQAWNLIPPNPIIDYVKTGSNPKAKHVMKSRFQEYEPKTEYLEKLRLLESKTYLLIFSADWCSDCHAQLPALAQTLTLASNERILRNVTDYYQFGDLAEEMRVTATPTIIVLDKNFREVG